MRKTTETKGSFEPITVNLQDLMSMLGTGKKTAQEVATASGAVVKVGRRTIYNVAKIRAYMAEISA